MTDPAPHPHDPIEPIATDLFTARGRIRSNAIMRITRNMASVRHRAELRLVNPTQNCFVESFNGKLRDECLSEHCLAWVRRWLASWLAA